MYLNPFSSQGLLESSNRTNVYHIGFIGTTTTLHSAQIVISVEIRFPMGNRFLSYYVMQFEW